MINKFVITMLLIVTQLSALEGLNLGNYESINAKDVCVIGGGSSGVAATVFLKDKGKDVVLFEITNRIGGHCNTETYNLGTTKTWIDLGVQDYRDLKQENLTSPGLFTFDSKGYVERFVGSQNVEPFDVNVASTNFGVDFSKNLFLGPLPSANPAGFDQAFVTLETIFATYPWLQSANIPDPIPAELLLPFDQFIAKHNLQPLNSIFLDFLFIGGAGPLNELTSLYALLFVVGGLQGASGFGIVNGCQSLYDSIENHLGSHVVVKNANVVQTIRSDDIGPVVLVVQVSGKDQIYFCGDIIVSFPQTLSSLSFLDLTPKEINVFKNVQTVSYIDVGVNVTSPLINGPFNIININISNPGVFPSEPFISTIGRQVPAGLSSLYGSPGSLTDAQFIILINNKLSSLGIFTNATITEFNHHTYLPHFPASFLAQSPNPYTLLSQLQGYKHTYWTGALLSENDSPLAWQHTSTLIDKYFSQCTV